MRLGWGAVLVISAAQFGAYADRALTAAFATELQADFLLSDAQIGMLHGTAVIIPYTLGMVAASLWLRAGRPFLLMALSVAVWTMAAAAFALATSTTGLFGARMMLGLSQAVFMPAALSILSVTSHPPPSVAISTLTTASATGRSGGLLLGGALLLMAAQLNVTALDPWRVATLAVIAPNLLLAVALLAKSGMRTPHAPSSGLIPTLRLMAIAPKFHVSYFVTAAAAIIVVQAEGAWAPTLLHRDYGLSVADSAVVAGLIILVAAPIGHLGAGRMVASLDRGVRWPHAPILLGLIVTLGSAVLLFLASKLNIAIIALAGFSAGGGFAAAAALIGLQAAFPAEQRFAANTVFIGTVTLAGYGIGPWVAGALSDSLGQLRLAIALVTASAFAVAALAALAGRHASTPGEARAASPSGR